MSGIKENLQMIFDEISSGNNLGEKITLLGATKFVDTDRINEAIAAGLTTIGENHAQELRDKLPFYAPCEKHFIGTLQKNKLKYVVGKVYSIDSVSSEDLAEEIDKKAESLKIVQNVMIEINAGCEQCKTGTSIEGAKSLYKSIIDLNHLKLVGIMAMLPMEETEEKLAELCREIRAFYDGIRKATESVKTLSIGMSGDYKIAIRNGSNMIRIGRAIFGERK